MPLADSSRAIGAVTGLLTERIEALTSHNVTVGRPEPPSANGGLSNPRLNLFLYEALFDPHLKNTPLGEGEEPPLWLVLRYLVTPFDGTGESDTADAFGVLGDGLRALQAVAHLPLTGLQPEDQTALEPNPERMKVTFNEAPSTLLSSLMQGTDEKYRFSMTFEVGPVMIAPAATPSYALLVGVDYAAAPPGERADAGVGLSVEPTLGPVIERVTPSSFAPGDPPVRIEGEDLNLEGLEVQLGPVVLPLERDAFGNTVFDPTTAALDGDSISAGSHPLSVARTLATGRRRAKQPRRRRPAAAAHLGDAWWRPTTSWTSRASSWAPRPTTWWWPCTATAPPCAPSTTWSTPPAPRPRRRTGAYASGPSRSPAGTYRVLLRVGGQQARESPEVVFP